MLVTSFACLKLGELETKLSSLESSSSEARTHFDSKIDNLEAKIDETLTESISVLKQGGGQKSSYSETSDKGTVRPD